MREENKNSISPDSPATAVNDARLNLLYEIGRVLASLETMNEAAPQILEAICRNLRFELGELWCLGKGETALHLESVWHLPSPLIEKFVAESRRFEFPVGMGLPGKVWAKNAPVWLENLSGEDRMPRRLFAEKTGLRSGFAFPILLGEKFIGTFSFFTRESRRRDETLLQMFAAVGNHIGQFIKRERVENHLRESEESYRIVAETASDAIIKIDADSRILFVNSAVERIFGYRVEEMLGQSLTMIMPEDLREKHRAGFRRYLETGKRRLPWESLEIPALHADGHLFPLEISFGEYREAEKRFFIGIARDITRRKRAEEAARESEERFRLLTENAEDYAIIFLDTDARITKWNVGAERILGWTESEAVGQSGAIIFTPEDRADGVPERELATAAERGHARDERWHLRRDGSRLFAFGEMIALYDEAKSLRGFAKMFRDLTAHKRLDDALRESEERYRRLFNSIDEGCCIIEMIYDEGGNPVDYRFLQINPSFEKQTGLKNAQGKTMREIFPRHEEHWFEIYGAIAATGEAVRFENYAEQFERWFDVFAFRFGAPENRQVAVLFSDITERKEIEAARERLLVREQKARQIAEDANHAKDEFIALVSHELRSPLNAMLGWTRILQEQKPDEKTKEYALHVIARNARSQSRLIEDLLDIARVAKGKLRLEMQPTELMPIINHAVEIIKPTAETGGIELTETLDRTANFITGDVDRLRQVIENLLSNAVKFTAPGGSVRVSLKRDGRDAKIIVSDTGQGISPEFLPQIFERFKQAESSITRRHGGLGIGLSLARDLVELHGGAISAESAGEDAGATFTVTLPLRVIAPIKENSSEVEFMDAQGKLSGFWILAVDDEADARELVSFMLQINGAKVTTANSAVEAIDILKNADGRLPDILLSDISMPNESGYALLEKIRSLPREHGGQIPAVALTAFNRPEDREAAFDAGFQKHLGKPVEPEDLISAIIETARR